MPSGENGCGMGETNSSRQPSFESDLHAVDGGQRRFLRLTLSDSWIGVRVVYGTGLERILPYPPSAVGYTLYPAAFYIFALLFIVPESFFPR